MPFPVPSAEDLQAQILADQQARIPGADTSLRVSTLKILAFIWARSLALIWGFLGRYWAKQFFIDSAETTYLERRCAAYGITRKSAAPASGPVIFYGSDIIPIPAGTIVQVPGGGAQYATVANLTMSAGTGTVGVVAAEGGVAGNQPPGSSLQLYIAIAGASPLATVASAGLTGGAEPESDASLRIRGLARQAQPPHGGAWFDYVAWAKAVPGVSRVWVYPLERGAGTVDVRFVVDGRPSIIPLAGDIAAVQAAIDAFRPVTADCFALAPATAPLAITITGLTPGDTLTRANVTAQLNALVRQIAPGGAVLGDGVSAAAPGGILHLSEIDAAIQAAGGIRFFDLTAPAADVTYAAGVMPATPTVIFL